MNQIFEHLGDEDVEYREEVVTELRDLANWIEAGGFLPDLDEAISSYSEQDLGLED